MLTGWARDGLSEEQIAHNMGISRETLRQWKNKFFGISVALKKGKDVADIEVENALYKRAVGYSYNEITKEAKINPETNKIELVTTKVVTKQVAPDTGAAAFWLKNRRPDKWREKREVEVGTDDKTVNVVVLPEVEKNAD